MRRCTKCEIEKPVSSFPRDGRRRDGLALHCRDCRNEYLREYRGRKDTRERQGAHFRARYGITVEEYESMAAAQDGRCACCGDIPEHQLHVDHDHATREVRGLLCTFCNKGLGCFRDDPKALRSAASYLESRAA